MCAVNNLATVNIQTGLERIADKIINDVKSDVKEGITNVQKEALSFFGNVKKTITKNLSALKALFISGSMVVAVVAAVKGLAAVGLAALGPAGWAVIGGAFLIGLAISAYEAHGKGKNIFKGMMSDVCTYTALCVLSVANKMIAENKSFCTALVSLKDDMLGKSEEHLKKIKKEIRKEFSDTENKIKGELGSVVKNLEEKQTLLQGMIGEIETELVKLRQENKDKDTIRSLESALETFKNGKVKKFSNLIENLNAHSKKITEIFKKFTEDLEVKQEINGEVIKADVMKVVNNFLLETSDIHDILGKIAEEAKDVLNLEIDLPKAIEGMMNNGTIKALKYGTSEFAKQCFKIEKAFSGNEEAKEILRSVSENIKDKKFENLEHNFACLTNLAKKNEAVKQQIQELKQLSEDIGKEYQDIYDGKKTKTAIHNFLDDLFGVNKQKDNAANNNPEEIINQNA